MSYAHWPIRSEDKPRLEQFLTILAKRLDKKLSYVDVACLIFDHSDVVIDVITAEQSAVKNERVQGSVAA